MQKNFYTRANLVFLVLVIILLGNADKINFKKGTIEEQIKIN